MQRISLALLAAALVLLAGCSGYRHQQWRNGDPSAIDTAQYSLRFIESDDEGWFWDGQQAQESIRLIRRKLAERKTLVVMFVHGWHHSSQCCDGNVEGFRNTLAELSRLLGHEFNIVGLYIGWRGRSLPGWLNYFTFWGRKSAAERVGQNDLKELIGRLQDLYIEYRPDVRAQQSSATAPAQEHKNFLGLATLGHSFGAQVLLRAVAGSLEDRLQHLNPQPAYLRDARPAQPDPTLQHSLSGVGDLIVLINPAAEASQYHRLHVLSQGLSYSPLQTPVMLVVSAQNDWVRHRLFTFGRWLGEIFTGKPYKHDEVERTVERQALGVYRGHITHRLKPVDPNVALVHETIWGDARQCRERRACKVEWHTWAQPPRISKPNSLVPGDPRLGRYDFSAEVTFNGVQLAPLTAADLEAHEHLEEYGTPQPYQPLIVATTDSRIIDDHNGIFTDPFLRFLVPYIAYIEEKSLLNVASNRAVREHAEEVMQRRD